MSGERGEKSGRWVAAIVSLIWAVSLVGFSFEPSGINGREFPLNLEGAVWSGEFPSDGSFPKYDSLNVERAGYWSFGPARSVLAEGGYVYVGYGGGIWIFDVSEPDSPVVVGMVATPDLVEDVVYHDGVLYVANSYAGVTAIDVSDPEAPEVVGNYGFGWEEITKVRLWYPYLFAKKGDFREHIVVLDVSNPEDMEEIGVELEWGGEYDVKDGYLYKVTPGMVRVIDVHNPLNPVERGKVIVERIGSSGIKVSGGYAYISRERGLWVVDVHDPDSIYVASVDSTWVNLTGLDVEGGYAYVKSGGNLVVYDIGDPHSPCVVGSVEVGAGDKLSAMEGYVYVVDRFKVVDCRDPSAPELVYEKLDGPGVGMDVDAAGGYCYYACSEGGVYILKRRPEGMQMEVVGHIGGLLGVREADRVRVDSVRNRVYVAGNDSLRVYDVSDVSHPVMLGECYVGHWSWGHVDLELCSGEVLVVVGGKLRVVDVSDPGEPIVVGEFEGHGGIAGAEVRDDSLVYLWGDNYLYVVDVSDGYNPEEVVEYDLDEMFGGQLLYLWNLWAFRDYIFLYLIFEGNWCWMYLYDMSDVYNMQYVDVLGGPAEDMAFEGGRACVLNWAQAYSGNITVYDFSGDPDSWSYLGGYWFGSYATWPDNVCCEYGGGLMYVVTLTRGLLVFHYLGDTVGVREGREGSRRNLKLKVPSLLRGERASVELSVPASGVVKLDLYDVSGRRVRELWGGYVNKGNRRIEVDLWGLGSGVYFLRAEVGGDVEVRRFILVR